MAFVIFESFAGIWVLHGEQMVEELSNWKAGAVFALWGGDPVARRQGAFLYHSLWGGALKSLLRVVPLTVTAF